MVKKTSKNILEIKESDIPKSEEITGRKLVRNAVYISIEGDDKVILENLFKKTLSGSIEINELKSMIAFLTAVCKSSELQLNTKNK